MKIEDITKLKQEGFSAQEIVELAKIITVEEAAPAPVVENHQEAKPVEPTKEVVPEVDPIMAAVSLPVVEKPKAEPVVPVASNSDPMQAILDQLSVLTKTLQANAILKDRVAIEEEGSAEDALASILLG